MTSSAPSYHGIPGLLLNLSIYSRKNYVVVLLVVMVETLKLER